MPLLPQAPLTFRQVLAYSIRLYKKSLPHVLILIALLFLLQIVLQRFLGDVNQPSYVTIIKNAPIKVGSLFAIYIFIYCWLSGTLYYHINNILLKQPCKLSKSLTFTLKKMPALLISLLIAGSCYLLGLILFVVPGFYIVVINLFYWPLVLTDDLGPLQAFKKVLQLVKGNWWRCASVIAALLLSIFLLVMLFTLLILSVGMVVHWSSHTTDLIFKYMQPAISLLLAPLFAAIILVQLHNLKLRKAALLTDPVIPLQRTHG